MKKKNDMKGKDDVRQKEEQIKASCDLQELGGAVVFFVLGGTVVFFALGGAVVFFVVDRPVPTGSPKSTSCSPLRASFF